MHLGVCACVCVSETVFVSLMKGSGGFFFFFTCACLILFAESFAAVTFDQKNSHTQSIFVMFLVTAMVSQKRLFDSLSSFDVTQETGFFSFSFSVNEIVFHCL